MLCNKIMRNHTIRDLVPLVLIMGRKSRLQLNVRYGKMKQKGKGGYKFWPLKATYYISLLLAQSPHMNMQSFLIVRPSYSQLKKSRPKQYNTNYCYLWR